MMQNIVGKLYQKCMRGIRLVGMSKSVISNKKLLFFDTNTFFVLHKSAKIELMEPILFNVNCRKPNGRSSMLIMESNSQLNVRGRFLLSYGADITLFEGAILTVGSSYINCDCKIRCHEAITIGNNCVISHDFIVMDSDAHSIDGCKYNSPVIIEDNVWIGTRVTILSGVKIGEGAVIAAGSVVNKEVPPNCLVAGVPAKVIRENVRWAV